MTSCQSGGACDNRRRVALRGCYATLGLTACDSACRGAVDTCRSVHPEANRTTSINVERNMEWMNPKGISCQTHRKTSKPR